MRFWGVVLIGLAVCFYVLSYGFLGAYHEFPTTMLSNEFTRADRELKQRDQDMTLPEGGSTQLGQMRRDRALMLLELKRRDARGDLLAPILGLLGLAMMFIPKSGGKKVKQKLIKTTTTPAVEVSIPEANPREEYVDEWEFQRRLEGGFRTREEAVEWLYRDPLLKCDYCGAKLRATFSGEREALEFLTFYKKVPEGAKDLRIVLGSRWFTKPASELKCVGCERIIRR